MEETRPSEGPVPVEVRSPHGAAAAPQDEGPGGGGGPVADTEQLRAECDQLRDRLLRTAAEFDNYRKRIDRERRDHAALAAADLLAALLPIVDDLERALAVEPGGEADTYREGVDLIYRQVLDLLERRGVKPIEAVGADFDPRVHEAMLYEESPGHRPGEVVAQFRRGYTLGDRLLRAAMVKVAKA